MRIKLIALHTKGATIVELMVVLAILGLGITALLQTIGGGINYSRDTENNIKAINIAREGIEGMLNIRDTNWLRFSSDKTNCWKVDRYNSSCISDTTGNYNILPGSYTIYSSNGIWLLHTGGTAVPYTSWSSYKNIFGVRLDESGFYSQTGTSLQSCSSWKQTDCNTIFTREITVENKGTSTGEILIKSIARWYDKRPQSVILETTLSNWKSNF